MKIHLHQGDLPDGLDLGKLVAIDTETLGLNPFRDRLCLAQLSAGDGVCHAVQFAAGKYAAPNLKRLLADPSVTKLFHFARFDVAALAENLAIAVNPIFCTKIGSRLGRTYSPRHGLKDVVQELVKPGRDVRDDLPAPILRTDVLDIKDLKPGMELTGTVRNVVDFGVFVDIGVHQDGLVHISQICDRFIKHPSQAVAVGDVVKVVVLEVDEKKHRISLSMRQAAGKK